VVRRLLLLVILLALGLQLFASASADSPGSGGAYVINVPPSFQGTSVEVDPEETVVRIEMLDTNGAWGPAGDIYTVDVTVRDKDGMVISAMTYKQYADRTSSVVLDRFSNPVGNNIVLAKCGASHPPTDPALNPEHELAGSELDVVFTFVTVRGVSIDIAVEDREGASSEISLPYSSTPEQSLPRAGPENVIAAALISAIAACAGTYYISKVKK